MTAPPATVDTTSPVALRARRPPVPGRSTSSSAVGAPSAPGQGAHVSIWRKRSSRRKLRLIAGFGAAIGLVTLLALQRSTLAGSVSALRTLRWRWIPVVVVGQLLSLEAVARTHRQLLRVSGVVMHPRPIRTIVYASTAISVSLPLAGSQVSAGYSLRELVRRGADSAAVAWMLVASGIAATTAFALLIAAGTAATGNPAAVIVAICGTLLTVIPALLLLPALRRPAVRRGLERLVIGLLGRYQRFMRRPAGTPARVVHEFLSRLASYRATPRQQAVVLGLALVNWLADCLCLTASIAAVGAPIPWQGLLLAYVGAPGVNSLGLTPGGRSRRSSADSRPGGCRPRRPPRARRNPHLPPSQLLARDGRRVGRLRILLARPPARPDRHSGRTGRRRRGAHSDVGGGGGGAFSCRVWASRADRDKPLAGISP